MKILSFHAEHIKRLHVVDIDAAGHAVVLAGENEQGKSSILDAIEMALVGKRACPPQPIHDGEKRGKVVLDMGDYRVIRTFTPGGNGTLTVEAPNGSTLKSPQAVLDKLTGDLTFDPMAFTTMEPVDRTRTLRTLAGLDTTAIDTAITDKTDELAAIRRDLKLQRAALEEAPRFTDVGTEIVDAEKIAAMLAAADEADRLIRDHERARDQAARELAACTRGVDEAVARVATLRAELDAAEAHERARREAGNEAWKAHKAAEKALAVVQAEMPDTAAIRQTVVDSTDWNRKVAANLRYHEISRRLDDQDAAATTLADAVATLKADRGKMLAGATFPVDGLGLAEDGTVTWKGLPFEQASEAVRIMASVAIGLALNPTLKILLIRNGNDLGQRYLHQIAEMAANADAQVWIERIAGGDGLPTVVIEDGRIVERREAIGDQGAALDAYHAARTLERTVIEHAATPPTPRVMTAQEFVDGLEPATPSEKVRDVRADVNAALAKQRTPPASVPVDTKATETPQTFGEFE